MIRTFAVNVHRVFPNHFSDMDERHSRAGKSAMALAYSVLLLSQKAAAGRRWRCFAGKSLSRSQTWLDLCAQCAFDIPCKAGRRAYWNSGESICDQAFAVRSVWMASRQLRNGPPSYLSLMTLGYTTYRPTRVSRGILIPDSPSCSCSQRWEGLI
jgi:hypothetical protein